jgi:hypothetical protein
VVVNVFAVGEEVAVAAAKAIQLGLPCYLTCRAAAVEAMAMAMAKAKFAAPLGAGKVAEVFFCFSCGRRSEPASVCVSAQGAAPSGSILMNASRAADIFYYVAHIDYIQYIGGLKPIEGGLIFICLQLQQLHAIYKPHHHRRDGHHLCGVMQGGVEFKYTVKHPPSRQGMHFILSCCFTLPYDTTSKFNTTVK